MPTGSTAVPYRLQASAIEDERIYAPVKGENRDWNPVRVGAVLLGSDIAAITERASLAELMRLDRERLTDALARQSDVNNYYNVNG